MLLPDSSGVSPQKQVRHHHFEVVVIVRSYVPPPLCLPVGKAFRRGPRAAAARVPANSSTQQQSSVSPFTEAGPVAPGQQHPPPQQQQQNQQQAGTGLQLGQFFSAGVGMALAFTCVGAVMRMLGF